MDNKIDYKRLYNESLCRAKNMLDIEDVEEIFFPTDLSDSVSTGQEIIEYLKGEFGDGERQLTPRTNQIKRWYDWLNRNIDKEITESLLCNDVSDKIHSYIANNFITGKVVKTDVISIIRAMEEGVKIGLQEANKK